jgi:hypothetical protein
MRFSCTWVAIVLLGSACGRALPSGYSSDETETSDGSGSSATSATSATASTSSSSSSETDDDDGESEDTNFPGFVPLPDTIEWLECDAAQQDCPEGEKCVPYGSTGGNWDAWKCVAVVGDQAPGEPCTYGGTVEATDDCDATSHCWDLHEVDGEAIGTCRAFCKGTFDVPVCPAMHLCLISSSGIPFLCIPTCDPIVQDCGEGLACYWASNDFNCVFTTQDIPPGEPCGFINDCVAGSGCLTEEVFPDCAGSACCSPWCDLELGDGQCAAVPGTACVAFFEEGTAPPGYDHVGVCMLP